jgi:type I restriction enzyme S subunit
VAAEHLLTQFDEICDGHASIQRIRRLVLQLAVRGRLVAQESSDDRVDDLVAHLATEKVRLGAPRRNGTGGGTPSEDLAPPFVIPPSWRWCRLSDIGIVAGGGTPPAGDSDNFADGGTAIAWLTPADLGKHADLFISHGARDLTPEGLRASSATLLPAGSVLFTSRAPIGYTAIAANEISTNQGFKSVVPFVLECNRYIEIYFRAFADWINERASGTTFREAPAKLMVRLPFPLPPLAEQQRIAARVDELIALSDALERVGTERSAIRRRLATGAAHRLTQAKDEAELRAGAEFQIRNLELLTATPDQLGPLRETILMLAVTGNLVRQVPQDEPTELLLKRIDDERRALHAAGERRVQASSLELLNEHLAWPVPLSWSYRALGDLMLFIDYRGKTPAKTSSGVRLVTAKNIKPGIVADEPREFVSEETYGTWMTRGVPRTGDVLFTTEAPLGNAAVVTTDERFALAQRAICFRLLGRLNPRFVELQIRSPAFQELLRVTATGLTAKGIKASKLKRLPFALPSLAEQTRIVEKVDELMNIIAALEAQLAAAITIQDALAGAVVDSTLSRSS